MTANYLLSTAHQKAFVCYSVILFPWLLILLVSKSLSEAFSVNSECDYYGASCVVASLCGLRKVPRSYAVWKHGWSGTLPLKYPGQLVLEGSKDTTVLVHTPEQEVFLRSHGYAKVLAVGMPFCYALSIEQVVHRVQNSLLVMPPHSSRHLVPRFDQDSYVNSVVKLRDCFDRITVCITSECDRHKQWRLPFESAGFEVIRGASIDDPTSLIRMVSLFKKYDVVTSPVIGSHWVYAGLCGCRLSLWGDSLECEFTRSDLLKEPYYQRYPEILDLLLSEEAQLWRKSNVEAFACSPLHASAHVNWAREASGFNSMIEPRALARLMGWSPLNQLRKRYLSSLKRRFTSATLRLSR